MHAILNDIWALAQIGGHVLIDYNNRKINIYDYNYGSKNVWEPTKISLMSTADMTFHILNM
jgi:hypothetical protein